MTESIEDKPITLTVGELKKLLILCEFCGCDRLATQFSKSSLQDVCDTHGEQEDDCEDTDFAETIRAVQARIDVASTERWAVAVKCIDGSLSYWNGKVFTSFGVPYTWTTEAEAQDFATWQSKVCPCKAVRL